MKHKTSLIAIAVIVILVIAYFTADAVLFDGVKPKPITENGFHANYYAKKDLQQQPAILVIGGGQWGDYWANTFANQDMVGLSLPYVGEENLPQLPEEIDLAYFETAIKWLLQQPSVASDKVIVMGASRNAELALVIAATFPKLISGVVAYAPSAVSWSNTVLPYNSDEIKPSWTYKGKAIPYISMHKITGNESTNINMLDYWKTGLSKTSEVQKAQIKVEQISGPILLFSGMDDQVWPSALMADMIEDRLKAHDFKYAIQNITYENAGHLISANPEQASSIRTGRITIDGKPYDYQFGGTNDGDFKAKTDAKLKLMAFLKGL
mgnify:CR=1 FL=1